MIWLMIIIFLIGVSSGCVIAEITTRKKKPIGNLRIDKSDPEDGPYFFLELTESPYVVERADYVTLKVVAENYISQE